MPKVEGIELSKFIIEQNPHQHIIVTSAYNDSDKLLALINIGISDFILKPLESEKLLKVLYKVTKSAYNQKREREFLLNQEKLILMGKMVDMIAHQWLQYINVIALKAELLGYQNREKILTPTDIEQYVIETKEEIDSLVKILNEFRDFFKKKSLERCYLNEVIDGVLLLLKDYLSKNGVVVKNCVGGLRTLLYETEFKQVLLNIFVNMVENFNERGTKKREIFIKTEENFDNIILSISDTGGGIDNSIIDKVFEPHFTTKQNGSGIGLYLSRLILEKIGSSIEVKNRGEGVEFIITLKKDIDGK
jgi:signal transduction histidine kinase